MELGTILELRMNNAKSKIAKLLVSREIVRGALEPASPT